METTLTKAKTYFAVGYNQGETPHEVAKLVLMTAKETNSSFRGLEIMDTLTVGVSNFVRFRTDLTEADKLLNKLAENRSVVRHGIGNFVLSMPNGRKGSIPSARMFAAPIASIRQVYRGTAMKLWEEQFGA